MANQYLFTDALADYLVGLISEHLQTAMGLRGVFKTHGDGLKECPRSESLAEMLPAVYVVSVGPKVLPGRVIGPVVDVEERFRVIYLKATEDERAPTGALNTGIVALSDLLADHALLEDGVLGEHTQQLKPVLIGAVEYDPPELRPWKKLNSTLTGCAIPVTIATTTTTAE